MGRLGSKCEISNRLHAANWETPPARSKVDVRGGSLFSLPGSCASSHLHTPIKIAELPLEILEPPSPSLKHSGHQVGDKILKFLKLRKKSNSEARPSQVACQPSLATFRFQDQRVTKHAASVEDVDLERYHYDSDENSESFSTSGATCDRHHGSSCSASDPSSSRSSASAQSFSSMTSRSSVTPGYTPRSSFICGGTSGHQSGAQLMANILISISNLDEDDEIGYEYDHPSLDGPHESAWHQPRDEMFAAVRHSSAKQSSGRNTPRLGRCSVDLHLTSPGPSRRFGKLDLSRIEKLR